jgi:hypothetical protein
MSETYTYDNLLIGDDSVTDSATLVTGQNLKRGAALGKVTASGKLAQLDSTKSDGTQTPYAILAVDMDATSADKTVPVYKFGEFNQAAVTFTGSDTYATHKEGFRDVGIFLKGTIAA